MAYYLYKKFRDHKNAPGDLTLQTDESIARPGNDEPCTPATNSLYDAVEGGASHAKKEQTVAGEKLDSEALATSKIERRAIRNYQMRIVGGLFLPLLVFSLNKTMVAAALPFIASDFNQFSQLNWIISAAELTATAFTPAWGQFADIFGRYPALQASSLVMIIGSALSGSAPKTNFPMFLAGRGLQGVGIAGNTVLSRVILSDKVTLKDNAVNNTAFAVVCSIGFGVGPIIGGYLTEVTWRWVFIINIPITAVGIVVAHFILRPIVLGAQEQNSEPSSHRPATRMSRILTIDFGGQLLFLFGMGLLILALTWAGAYYPWADAKVLATLIIGSMLLISFLVWEFLLIPDHLLARTFPNQKPMISLNLLWTRNAGILVYINFITGMAMYAVFYFVDLYFTIVRDFGSNKAGANLLYYLPGLGAGSYLSMVICNVTPRRTWYPLSIGTAIEAVGITVLAAALHWNKLPTIYALLAVTGFGTGIRFMPNTLHAVGYYRKHVATIISLMSVAVSFGSALASTIMLNIFNNRMSSAGISLVHGPSAASSLGSIHQLPPDQQSYIRHEAKNSLVVAFYGVSSFMWLGVVAVAFLGNVRIGKNSDGKDSTEDGQTIATNLTKGSYIGSLFRKTEDESTSV